MKVHALVLASLALTGSAFAAMPSLNCSGTEPFWSLVVDGSNVRYTDASDAAAKVYTVDTRTQAAGMVDGYAFQISATRLTKENKKRTAVLSVINAGDSGCTDGMSDTVYKYHLLVKVDGTVLYGCCH